MNSLKTHQSLIRILSFDWAIKKKLAVHDSKTQKVKSIANTIEEFEKFITKIKEPSIMLFEFGGGDTFKILAFRAGHTIFQVPGKKIKDFRDSKALKKNDAIDAKAIYDFFIENGGRGAILRMRNSIDVLPSPSKNKSRGSARVSLRNSMDPLPLSAENKGGSANSRMRDSTSLLPSPFYLFTESNAEISEIKILYRAHEDLKQAMVREKNKLFAFDFQFKIARVADDRISKIKAQKEISIKAKESQLEDLKRILKKKVESFPVWTLYEGVRGVGTTILAGLIGELGGRVFGSSNSLKHYSGMIEKKGNHNFNRYVKQALFQFTEQVIKHKTPKWRNLYDNMKIFYAEKHPDWSKGKVNNYAKKFIQTKFVLEFWEKWKELEC